MFLKYENTMRILGIVLIPELTGVSPVRVKNSMIKVKKNRRRKKMTTFRECTISPLKFNRNIRNVNALSQVLIDFNT